MAGPGDDEESRKRVAESIRRQIQELAHGTAKPQQPRTLRDFIADKMAEDETASEEISNSKEATDTEGSERE